jgi:hypothetical protein
LSLASSSSHNPLKSSPSFQKTLSHNPSSTLQPNSLRKPALSPYRPSKVVVEIQAKSEKKRRLINMLVEDEDKRFILNLLFICMCVYLLLTISWKVCLL